MQIEDAADAPTIQHLTDKAIAMPKIRLPQSEDLECFPDVIVRAAVGKVWTEWIRIFVVRTGPLIHTLAVLELRVEHELPGHLMLESDEESIVVGRAIVAVVVDRANERVKSKSLGDRRDITILLNDHVPCNATLVARREYHVISEIDLRIEGIVLRVDRWQG